MDRPDSEAVRAELPQATAALVRLGYALDDPDPLDPVVETAIEYVEAVTGRYPLESTVPDALARTALRAVALRTLQQVFQDQSSYMEDVSSDLILSFSAGSYSETRRDASKSVDIWSRINSWPALAQLLWLLMTDEMKDEWREIAGGLPAPAFAVTEVDWSPVDVSEGGYWEHG